MAMRNIVVKGLLGERISRKVPLVMGRSAWVLGRGLLQLCHGTQLKTAEGGLGKWTSAKLSDRECTGWQVFKNHGQIPQWLDRQSYNCNRVGEDTWRSKRGSVGTLVCRDSAAESQGSP